MANLRPEQLPNFSSPLNPNDVLVIDQGARGVNKGTVEDLITGDVKHYSEQAAESAQIASDAAYLATSSAASSSENAIATAEDRVVTNTARNEAVTARNEAVAVAPSTWQNLRDETIEARDESIFASNESLNYRNQAQSARDAAFVNANVYSTIAAGISATPNGDQFQVVVSDDILRYSNNSGTAVQVASYPSSSKVDSLLSPKKNLVNPNLIRRGKRFSPANGQIITDASYRCTGFIPVIPGQSYAISGIQVSPGQTGAWFQSASDTSPSVQINSASLTGGQGVRQAPAGYNFLVINITNGGQDNTIYDNTIQVENGTVITPYEPYTLVINENKLPDFVERKEIIEKWSFNMIDPNSVNYVSRYSINTRTFTFDTLGIASSPLIPVIEGVFYTISGSALYTQSNVPQGGFFTEGASQALSNISWGTPPSGSGMIFQVPVGLGITHVAINLWKQGRVSTGTQLDGVVQLERGEVATTYQAYNAIDRIKEDLLPSGSSSIPSVSFDANAWYNFVYSDGGGVDLSVKLPLYRNKWLSKTQDLVVVNTGTSLTARSTEHCTDHPQAAFRPPLMHSMNYVTHVWDKLKWEGQEYRRYNAGSFFNETGTWSTSSNLPEWDDGAYRNGLTRYSESPSASVSFTIPAGMWAARFIYRTDSVGCSATVAIAGGNGLVQAYDETTSAWVEANGYVFSQTESAPVARNVLVPTTVAGATAIQSLTSKSNTTYQKRLKMRVVNRSADRTITISRTGGGARMMYWGVEWSPREHMVTYINAARGSHNASVTTAGLMRYQDNEVWGFKPDLMLFENPIHNDGAAGVSGVYAEGYWAWLTNRFVWMESFELSMKGSCDRLGLSFPEIAIFNGSIAWNFNGIDEYGYLKFGPNSAGHMMTSLDRFAEPHLYALSSHPEAVSIHTTQRWVDAAFTIFGNLRTATEGSGKDGSTFTNEGSHWNNTGSRIMAKAVLPVIPRVW